MKKFLTVFVLSLLACTAFFVGCKPNNEGNEPKIYTITYDLAGGKIEGEYKTSYTAEDSFTLPVPVKENYEFVCWTDANGKEWKEIKNQVGDKTFFANWRSMVFSITYELDGGVNSPDNPDSYESDSADIELKAPTKEGYIFLGWIDSATSGTTFVDKIPAGSKVDKTFVAKWQKEVPPEAETFVVKYELVYNGQRSTVENAADILDAEIKDGEAFNGLLPEAVPENPLYRFDGWVVITAEGEINITAGTLADETLLGEDGSTVRLYAKAVYREVAIVYNLTDTIQREYHSNNKGTFIDYMKYGKPLTADGGKTTVSEQTMRNGESFAGKLPAIDQKYCGWVYMTTEGYVYCSEKTVLDLSKAVIENGKLVLYACITDYWLGPY